MPGGEDYVTNLMKKRRAGRNGAAEADPSFIPIKPGQPGWAEKVPPGDPMVVENEIGLVGVMTPDGTLAGGRAAPPPFVGAAPGAADIQAVYERVARPPRVVIAYGPRTGTRLVGIERDGQITRRVVLRAAALESVLPILGALGTIVDLTAEAGDAG